MEYICSYCNKNFGNHQTEYRSHRKVCECKPEFFECKFCRRKFSRAGTCASHEKHDCMLNPGREKFERYSIFKDPNFDSTAINHPKDGGWTCRCGKNFRVRHELQDHRKVCDACKDKNREKTVAKKTYINFKCEFCGVEKETTREAATAHIKFCKENPNHLIKKSHTLSDEAKKKISEARKKYLNEHPDKVPFKLNHSSKESYPEKYFREWLQKENIFSEREYSVERYSLDFAWPEKGIYLEIDGGQHSLSWMKNHDKERTDFLTDKGWVCIARVFWPHFCSFNDDEKIRFLKSLKNTILTSEVFHDFRSEKELLQKEQSEYREELVKQGKVNSLGRPCNYMNSTEEWETRKNKILSCGVDLSALGWKAKVQRNTNLSRKQIDLVIERFPEDFNNVFRRKS